MYACMYVRREFCLRIAVSDFKALDILDLGCGVRGKRDDFM